MLNKEDLTFTCCRELEYEAGDPNKKCSLYGLKGILLDADSQNMDGMDSIMAYIVPSDRRESLELEEWVIYDDMDTITKHFHIAYEGNTKAYLCELLTESGVIIVEEQRCYLMPHTRKGASFIKFREQEYLLEVLNYTEKTEHYHFHVLPSAYESYGRTIHNYQAFMANQSL
ncbi:hypothetical protein [Vibrio sp. THAF190c]|uniref:hypothetical protein n=1 Tax=Vibrio sp. THAF190c TaxID=2587865 RepID=UPI001268296D|nr:hypothetical protein [Vibrio sp. THAF190c]QFT13525.1 hypothetical protein FIV04_26580 [Vibrio sp. THAF190c]